MKVKFIIIGLISLVAVTSVLLVQQVSLNKRYTLYLSEHSADILMQKLVDLTGVYVSYKRVLRTIESKPDKSLRSLELWGKQTLPLFNVIRDGDTLVFTGIGRQKDVLCLLSKLAGIPFYSIYSFSLTGLKHKNISFKIVIKGGANI